MQPQHDSSPPLHGQVIDTATLYLCRQGTRWVVVIESPGVTGAVPLPETGRNGDDAHFELVARARNACPDATIMSADGASTSEDYDWRVDVRSVEQHSGELGMALYRELASESQRRRTFPGRPVIGHRCHWGTSAPDSGRPRRF